MSFATQRTLLPTLRKGGSPLTPIFRSALPLAKLRGARIFNLKTIIIGAGAAGCFAAIELKRLRSDAEVIVLEKGRRPLAKVAITGGGRCNLTNSFNDVKSLETVYPRGFRLMKRLLHQFSHRDAYEWFEQEGVALVTQDDQCVFPQSQDAMQIVNTLTFLMKRLGVKVMTGANVTKIEANRTDENNVTQYTVSISTPSSNLQYLHADRVLVTTGGHPSPSGFDMLRGLDLEIVPPVPSLFSLCIDNKELQSLMGIVVEQAQVSLVGTKMKTSGPLLITHWGMSGPAVLRLSSLAARVLAESGYKTTIAVNWLSYINNVEVEELLHGYVKRDGQKKVTSIHPESLNSRLWNYLLTRAGISLDARWNEVQGRLLNRLINTLTNDQYAVSGKNRFKDEFVTCGGVALSNLAPTTLESKAHPGLFFAGEVTDVDAITGGFNLQAAWTMGYVAAQAIAEQ